MRRLVEDIQGLDHLFAELVDIAQDAPEHPDARHHDAPRRHEG